MPEAAAAAGSGRPARCRVPGGISRERRCRSTERDEAVRSGGAWGAGPEPGVPPTHRSAPNGRRWPDAASPAPPRCQSVGTLPSLQAH